MFLRKLFLGAISFLLFSCASPEAVREKGWKAYYEDGKLLDYQEKREQSRLSYETALSELSSEEPFEQEWRAEILARLARQSLQEGQFEEAAKQLDRALLLGCDPKLQGPYHGELLVTLDDVIDTGLLYVGEPNKETPALEMVLKVMDQAFQKRHKRRDKAIEKLAMAYILSGRDDDAAPLVRDIMAGSDEGKNYRAVLMLATAYHISGNSKEEKELFDFAQKIARARGKGALDYGYAQILAERLQARKQYAEALKVLKAEADKHEKLPNGEMLELLAELYDQTGDRKNAELNYRSAIVAERQRKPQKRKMLRLRIQSLIRFLKKHDRKEEAERLQLEADNLRDKKAW